MASASRRRAAIELIQGSGRSRRVQLWRAGLLLDGIPTTWPAWGKSTGWLRSRAVIDGLRLSSGERYLAFVVKGVPSNPR